MTKTLFVLDTNAILTHPDILEHYAQDELALPDTVLTEIDKLKITARTDADTRYQGREFTRRLFSLAQGGSLYEGINRKEGGSLRVLPFDYKLPSPEGLSAKNPDDRIVIAALRLQEELKETHQVIIVSSDLTLLLKAQAFNLGICQHEDALNNSFSKRYIIKPFQKYKTPLALVMLSITLFAASIIMPTLLSKNAKSALSLPGEYRNFLSEEQAATLDNLLKVTEEPKDGPALKALGEAYFDLYGREVKSNPARAVSYAKRGTDYFKRALDQNPDDVPSRCKMGILSLYAGDTDTAITQLTQALNQDPQNIEGTYYLAVVYMQGRHDLEAAEQLFMRVIERAGDSSDLAPYASSSKNFLEQIEREKSLGDHKSSEGVIL